jgi:hypothetical protein
MRAGSVASIEKNVDRAASALFGAACGYAAYGWVSAGPAPLIAPAGAVLAMLLAYVLSNRLLGRVPPEPPRLQVPIFDVREVEPLEETELLLTERFEAPAAAADADGDDALILDDILAKLEPDSRVVRLFDPEAMPTAGELKSRIDRHLDRDSAAAQTPDAAQALHEALAELRRSIR